MAPMHLSLVKKLWPPMITAALFLLVLSVALRTAAAGMLRVPEDEARKALVTKISPVVPALARQVHITGRVMVDMTVGEDGSVEKVDVVSGNPVLSTAVVSAGKKWMFKPFLIEGKAEKALVRVTFDFGS